VVGRDYYGVFPLKGKLLNVREASHAQIMKNEEIQNIAKILGLTFGKVYENCSSLRYGHLMIMTDQDHDGSHIKGLLINFLHHFWPSLLLVPGFLQQFITPIVKVTSLLLCSWMRILTVYIVGSALRARVRRPSSPFLST
jgi:DNA topoisomerase-2